MQKHTRLVLIVCAVVLLGIAVLCTSGCERTPTKVSVEEQAPCGYTPPEAPAPGARMFAAAAVAPATGLRRVAVVGGSGAQFITDVGSWWAAMSYGQANFEAVSFGSSGISTSCDPAVFFPSIVKALDTQVDWTQYRHIVYLASTSGCEYMGIGGQRTIATDDGVVTLGFARYGSSSTSWLPRHEFGHSFGLQHSYDRGTCIGIPPGGMDTCAQRERGGSDIMGSGNPYVNAAHLEWLGWIASQPMTLAGTYELPPLWAGKTAAFKLRRSVTDSLWIEFSSLSGLRFNTLGTEYLGHSKPLEVDPNEDTGNWLVPGKTLLDQGTGAVVTLISASEAGATVSIDPGEPDLTPPHCSVFAPVAGATVSGDVTLSVNVTETRPYRARFFITTTSAKVADLSVYAAPWKVTWDSRTVADGGYTFLPAVYDLAGNRTYCTGKGSIQVSNGSAPSPPATVVVATPLSTVTPTPVPAATRTPTRIPTKWIPPGQRKKTPPTA